MRYLKTIPLSIYAAGLLALSGCASESPEIPGATGAQEGEEFWLQFEISNPAESAETRATGNNGTDIEKTEAEATINANSTCVMLVDIDNDQPTYIRGIAFGSDKVKIESGENGKSIIKANMGLHTLFTANHPYCIFVFANLPASVDLSTEYNMAISTVGETVVSGLSIMTSVGADGIPMASLADEAKEVIVNLPSTNQYTTESSAFHVGTELPLTPLYARIDFVKNSTYPDFAYPISYKTGESTSVTEVKVQFTHAALKNAATKVNLLPNAALDMNGTALRSPSNMTFSNSSALVMQTSAPFLYLPEFVPTVSSSKLSFVETTYIELYAKLVADDTCNLADDVKTAINQASTSKTASPKLYYYDDGTSQSSLTTVSHAGEANWTELSYDATVDGYKLTYRHAIRHNTNGSDDGIINQQEYGVVRNYIYNIGIASVSSLPHQWADTENVENKRDVVLHITPHNWAKRTQTVIL